MAYYPARASNSGAAKNLRDYIVSSLTTTVATNSASSPLLKYSDDGSSWNACYNADLVWTGEEYYVTYYSVESGTSDPIMMTQYSKSGRTWKVE